jgi:hypothetical protein
MDERIRAAYIEHELTQATSGVLDHALDRALSEGKSIEEHMIETLRAAGKLPAGVEDAERAARRTA